MTLRVIGAGVARTGTSSLKVALQHLLGGDCYHMDEVLLHEEHVGPWETALDGHLADWDQIFGAYAATVDWPAAAFWSELAAYYPNAFVILSCRDEDEWWLSAQGTFVELMTGPLPDSPVPYRRSRMALDVVNTRFCSRLSDRDAMIRAYRRHNEAVRASFDRDRLLEWNPADGWTPLCNALGVDIPSEPFPRHNTRSEFRQRFGLLPSTPTETQ